MFHFVSLRSRLKLAYSSNTDGITFSFFSFHKANNDTPETLTTLNVTPPISPFALPFLPNPAIKTSTSLDKCTQAQRVGIHTIVLINEIKTTIPWYKACHSNKLGSSSN